MTLRISRITSNRYSFFREISEIISEPLVLEPLFGRTHKLVSFTTNNKTNASSIGVEHYPDSKQSEIPSDNKKKVYSPDQFTTNLTPLAAFPRYYDLHFSLWGKLTAFTQKYLQTFSLQQYNNNQNGLTTEIDVIGGECENESETNLGSGKYSDTFRSSSTLCDSNSNGDDSSNLSEEKRTIFHQANETEDWYQFILYFHDRLFLMDASTQISTGKLPETNNTPARKQWELLFQNDSFNSLVSTLNYLLISFSYFCNTVAVSRSIAKFGNTKICFAVYQICSSCKYLVFR